MLSLSLFGIAIVGRATAEDVENVNLFTLKLASRQNLVQELATATHERLAKTIFVCPWCLA